MLKVQLTFNILIRFVNSVGRAQPCLNQPRRPSMLVAAFEDLNAFISNVKHDAHPHMS